MTTNMLARGVHRRDLKPVPVPIRNKLNIGSLLIVAKEFIDCYGEVLIVMATNVLSRGVHNRFFQINISDF